MAEIIIKKKVTLEHLGEEYKDSFVTFKSIPIGEYEKLAKEIDAVEDKESMNKILEILGSYFFEGLFDGQKLSKEDMSQFDGETILKFFETLTGQKADAEGNRNLDPKSETELTSSSTTEAVKA